MKNTGLLLALWLALTGAVSAQVSVEVLLGQEQFLPEESIPVRVRIINNSGQTLHFGEDDWLKYSVEGRDGTVVLKVSDPVVPHDFDVQAAEMATAHADLAPYYNITKPGRYRITATVRIKDWGQEVSSPPKDFSIVRGNRLWEQPFGVPQSPTNHSSPEVRKYILQQATLAKRMKLYLRITDAAETKSIRIFPVGPMISFSDPQMRVDQASNLHLLYQSGAHIYSYTVTDPDGEVNVRQTYYYTSSAPRLVADDKGQVQIVGGVRHLADDDLPPSRKSVPTNDVPPHAP